MIAFKHDTKSIKKSTFAVQLPTKAEMLALMSDLGNNVCFKFGYSLVHGKDTLCKATGRTLACSRLEFRDVILDHVSCDTEKFQYFFRYEIPEMKYQATIALSVTKNSERVHFEYAKVWKRYP